MRNVALEDEEVDARRTTARPFDVLEDRRHAQPVAVQFFEEVAEKLPEAFLCDEPEVVAVVVQFVAIAVVPRSAADAVSNRIVPRGDARRCGRRD